MEANLDQISHKKRPTGSNGENEQPILNRNHQKRRRLSICKPVDQQSWPYPNGLKQSRPVRKRTYPTQPPIFTWHHGDKTPTPIRSLQEENRDWKANIWHNHTLGGHVRVVGV